MAERDERTGVSRVRANAAYVAARASRDVWPRNEKTGCVVMGDERTGVTGVRGAGRAVPSRERITVALADKPSRQLAQLRDESGLSRTDLVNRAVSLLHFVAAQERAGRQLALYDTDTEEMRLVHIT